MDISQDETPRPHVEMRGAQKPRYWDKLEGFTTLYMLVWGCWTFWYQPQEWPLMLGVWLWYGFRGMYKYWWLLEIERRKLAERFIEEALATVMAEVGAARRVQVELVKVNGGGSGTPPTQQVH